MYVTRLAKSHKRQISESYLEIESCEFILTANAIE